MFARAYFALRHFAARFFPQSQGDAPAATAPLCGTAGATPLYTATAGATALYTATASAEVC